MDYVHQNGVVHKKIADRPEKLLVNCTKCAIIKTTKARAASGGGIPLPSELPKTVGIRRQPCHPSLLLPDANRERRECPDETSQSRLSPWRRLCLAAKAGSTRTPVLRFQKQMERSAVPVSLTNLFVDAFHSHPKRPRETAVAAANLVKEKFVCVGLN